MVFTPEAIVRLENVSAPGTSIVAADVASTTGPVVTVRVPALWVRLPVIVKVPDVLVNVPPERPNGPFTVIAELPPKNDPVACVQPPAPTVTVRPAACEIAPVYPVFTLRPATLTLTSIVTSLTLVPSKTTVSAARGTVPPDQFVASDQLVVAPAPVHVFVAAATGCEPEATKSPTTAATATIRLRRRVQRRSRGDPLAASIGSDGDVILWV